ncbi:MAG: hypothetical protein RL660_2376 [Bacteroidota bacterium]|jgi:hypothetical protein
MIDHILVIENCRFFSSQHEKERNENINYDFFEALDYKDPERIIYTQLAYQLQIEDSSHRFVSQVLNTNEQQLRRLIEDSQDVVLRYNPQNLSEYLFWRKSTMQELY